MNNTHVVVLLPIRENERNDLSMNEPLPRKRLASSTEVDHTLVPRTVRFDPSVIERVGTRPSRREIPTSELYRPRYWFLAYIIPFPLISAGVSVSNEKATQPAASQDQN
jgi:hypothetical protein